MRRMAVAAVVALTSLGPLVGCGSDPDSQPVWAHSVVFRATGSGNADLAYLVGDNHAQDNNVRLPWQKTVRTNDATVVASVMVAPTSAGEVTCQLKVDGKLIHEAKSEGGLTTATCKTP